MPSILLVMPAYRLTFTPTLRGCFRQQVRSDFRLDFFFPYQGYGDGERDSRDIIAEKYNTARQHVLTGGYDAMFCVESDMIIPEEALLRLWDTGADIAYAPYVFRRQPWHWSAYSVLKEDALVGFPLSNVPDRARLDWGSVVEVDGVGLGCTLIRRHVLEQIPFRADGIVHADGERSHCDWYFALDAMAAGFVSKCDLSIPCGHICPMDREGKLGPCVIWPDIHADGLCRFEEYGAPGTVHADE